MKVHLLFIYPYTDIFISQHKLIYDIAIKVYFDQCAEEETPSMAKFFARYWSQVALEADNIETGQQLQKLWSDRFITVANEVRTFFFRDIDSEGWQELASLKTDIIAQDRANNIKNKQTIASLEYYDQSLGYIQQWLRDMEKRSTPLTEGLFVLSFMEEY